MACLLIYAVYIKQKIYHEKNNVAYYYSGFSSSAI